MKKIELNKNEKVIIDSYLAINQLKGSTQSRITALCEKGKQGQLSIIRIAQYLMVNGESTATLKVQVNRAMGKLKTNMSLQGVGKKDDPKNVTIAPKQNNIGNGSDKDKEKKAKAKEESVKKLDTTTVWDFVIERFTRDELEALVKEYNKAHKTKLKIAS